MIGLFVLIGMGSAWYVGRHAGELTATVKETARKAIVVGRSTDENGCEAAAEKRMAKAGMLNGVQSAIFLQACLKVSRPSAGYCDGVPAVNDTSAASAWLQRRCAGFAARPGDNMRCGALASVVQSYCTNGRPKQDPDSALARLDTMAVPRARPGGTK